MLQTNGSIPVHKKSLTFFIIIKKMWFLWLQTQ